MPGTDPSSLLIDVLSLQKDGMQLAQATGHKVDVEIREGTIYVNGAELLGSVDASNGIVYVVDEVFLLMRDA